MTGYVELTVVFLAAVNPARVAITMLSWRAWPANQRPSVVVTGLVVAAAIYVAAALAAEPLLDLLDVAPETFRIAAGIVMVTQGVHAVWGPRARTGPEQWGWQAGISPLGLPLLASPAAVIAVMSYGVDESPGLALAAAAPAVVASLALFVGLHEHRRALTALDAIAGLTGALLVVAGAGLIVSGVRAI